MSKQMTHKEFAAHVRTRFQVDLPTEVELELMSVKDNSNAQIEQFSLTFAGPAAPVLSQGTYMLRHAAMGEIAIFIVPIGPKDSRMEYESAFARIIQQSVPRIN